MKRVLCGFLSALLLLSTCGCSDRNNDYLADYDQLWADLERNYPFFPVLQEEKGIDAVLIRETYRPYVEKAESLEQFMNVLEIMFSQLLHFAHLSLLLRLERTGLLVYLTTAMAANPDGTLNALRGVTSDYSALKEKKSPLSLCLQLIDEENAKGE